MIPGSRQAILFAAPGQAPIRELDESVVSPNMVPGRVAVPDFEPAPLAAWRWAALAVLVSLVLSTAFCFKRAPFWDEGLFADVAMNFRDHGYLGTTVLEDYGHLPVPGTHRHVYWQFPLYMVTLGTWVKLVPATIEGIRLLSVFWQAVYLAAWFFFARSLTRNETLALWITAVVALDFSVIQVASLARMEIMIAALGMMALAFYTCLRDRNWTLGIFLAACCDAAAMCCHPMGVLMNVVLIAMVLYDWKKIQWTRVPIALVPYLIAGGLCYWYAMQAPDIFNEQLKAAAGYRLSSSGKLIWNLVTDIYYRYLGYYWSAFTGINRLKVAGLFVSIAGSIALLFSKAREFPGSKQLLMIGGISYILVSLIDNQHSVNYLVYSLAPLAACGAIWIWYVWTQKSILRYLAVALVAAAFLSTIVGYALKVRADDYRNAYDPAVAAIRQHLPPNGMVMGGTELAFALGFGPPLVDDAYVGYYSGKFPDVVAVNTFDVGYLQSGLDYAAATLRDKFRLVFENKLYKIYVRDPYGANVTAKK